MRLPPAVGDGMYSLERTVELFTLLFTLLSNNSSSLSENNRSVKSFFVPDDLI